MKGFYIAVTMLVLTTFSCGATFLAGNVGLTLPMLLAFYLMSMVAAYFAGRSVDIQSPFKPRGQYTEYRRNRPLPAAPAANGKSTSLLAKVRATQGQNQTDEFNQ